MLEHVSEVYIKYPEISMLRSFGSFAKGLKGWCFFTWFVCVWRWIDGDNRDITFRIGSNYLWMSEICWSSKNSTNQPSPKLRWSSKNHPPIVNEVGDDPPWGDLWWKSTYSWRGEKLLSPKESIGEQFNFCILMCLLSSGFWFLILLLQFGCDFWLLYVFTFDLISLIVFVAPLRLYVWWWFCSCKWLWLYTNLRYQCIRPNPPYLNASCEVNGSHTSHVRDAPCFFHTWWVAWYMASMKCQSDSSETRQDVPCGVVTGSYWSS